MSRARLRILTWHVHGNYLYYLSQIPHDLYVPVRAGRPEGYGGLSGNLPWPQNLHELPAEEVRRTAFDVVLFQSRRAYEQDQYQLLSTAQRTLPQVYLEHDPPRGSPTDCPHPFTNPEGLLVHVTAFNRLMWDNGETPTCVIDHGIIPPNATYTGEKERGLCIVNNLASRGRRLGLDVFEAAARAVPLDLIGMNSERAGGVGEVPYPQLGPFAASYRFLFNPIRYTSLGLAVCEAMMLGMPVVGLATTEMAATIENGVSGYVYTEPEHCISAMQTLLEDRALAQRLGQGAQAYARRRFHMDRFVSDWCTALTQLVDRCRAPATGMAV